MEIDRFVWYLKIHIIKEKGIHNMKYKLNGFQPKQALHFFEEISAIPRGSGNEAAVADYLVQFASARGLACIRDRANNVIIYEKGTHGGEDKPPVILQGHIDMVCEKVAGSTHDFTKDGIDIRIGPDGWATADGTTLGADDGAGAAAILAILDDADQPHPPIEEESTSGEGCGILWGGNRLRRSLPARLLQALRAPHDQSGLGRRGRCLHQLCRRHGILFRHKYRAGGKDRHALPN